jgi:hypothetical protein
MSWTVQSEADKSTLFLFKYFLIVFQVGDEKEVAKLGMEDSPVLGKQSYIT